MIKKRAKTLVNALMGGGPSIPEVLREDGVVKPLREMMKVLLKLEEDDWGLYAFSRDPLEGKFTRNQKYDYIKRANRCGREEAGCFFEELKISDNEYTIEKMNVSAKGLINEKSLFERVTDFMDIALETPDIPIGGGHVIFAQHTEPNKITVFMDAVKKAKTLILENQMQDMLSGISIYQLLLAHELFHVVEYKKETTIYTKTEKVELWRKPFTNRSGISALSEIAGMSFAKELLRLDYSPFALDVLLMYGYSPVAASALYDEIMDIVNII